MLYTIFVTDEAREFIKSLDGQKTAKTHKIYSLFEEYGRFLPAKYLKKLSGEVWELRPGDIRLFLAIRGNKAIIVHGILKKSQKTPKHEFETAERRIKNLIL